MMVKFSSQFIHSFIHPFIFYKSYYKIGKSHTSNSKSYSQLSSMYTWLRVEIVIEIL